MEREYTQYIGHAMSLGISKKYALQFTNQHQIVGYDNLRKSIRIFDRVSDSQLEFILKFDNPHQAEAVKYVNVYEAGRFTNEHQIQGYKNLKKLHGSVTHSELEYILKFDNPHQVEAIKYINVYDAVRFTNEHQIQGFKNYNELYKIVSYSELEYILKFDNPHQVEAVKYVDAYDAVKFTNVHQVVGCKNTKEYLGKEPIDALDCILKINNHCESSAIAEGVAPCSALEARCSGKNADYSFHSLFTANLDF